MTRLLRFPIRLRLVRVVEVAGLLVLTLWLLQACGGTGEPPRLGQSAGSGVARSTPADAAAEPPIPLPVLAAAAAPLAVDASTGPAIPRPRLVPNMLSRELAQLRPTVRFIAPANGQVISADNAKDQTIRLDVRDWPFLMRPGVWSRTFPRSKLQVTFVELTLDDGPSILLRDMATPLTLSSLPGGAALAAGQHVLAAYAATPSGSAKTPGALAVVEFFVDNADTRSVDLKKPLLIYSNAEAEDYGSALIDFQLSRDTLAKGHDHVRITVTGPGIDEHDPVALDVTTYAASYFLESPSHGVYTVKVELLSSDGTVVTGDGDGGKGGENARWNSLSREITVTRRSEFLSPP